MTLTETLIHAQMAGKRVESYNPADDDFLTAAVTSLKAQGIHHLAYVQSIAGDAADDELADLLADDEEFDWRGEGD